MILALDPGRTSAYATSSRETGIFLAPVDDDGRALHLWEGWLADLIVEQQPDVLMIERAFFGRLRDADWPLALIRAAHKVGFIHGVRRMELAAITVRKRVFGQGRGLTDKDRIRLINERGWRVKTDHEADAAALVEAAEMMAAEMATAERANAA